MAQWSRMCILDLCQECVFSCNAGDLQESRVIVVSLFESATECVYSLSSLKIDVSLLLNTEFRKI